MSRQFFLSMLLGAGALIATCAYSNTKHEVKMQSLNQDSISLYRINLPDSTIPNVAQAVQVKQGDILYLSGHVPMTEKGEILQGNLEQQLQLAFQNIEKTLKHANSSTENLVKLTIFVRDLQPEFIPVIRKVRDQFIQPTTAPASSLIGVAQLFDPAVLVEIEAIAVIPSQDSSTRRFLSQFLPTTHQKVHQQSVLIDGEQAQLVRYQTQSALTLDQANFSYLTDPTGHLKGFSYLDSSLIKAQLPTKAQAQRIADDFLGHYAPDLLSNREIHWIDRHDETIEVDSKKQQISGIKVKMRNLNDGRWFWVIIGSNRQPIIFERDIVWINFPGHRKTERWLHDSWLKDHIKIEVNTNEI